MQHNYSSAKLETKMDFKYGLFCRKSSSQLTWNENSLELVWRLGRSISFSLLGQHEVRRNACSLS